MPTLPETAGPDPARLLVRGVNWLGDAVMTTPALQRLRARFPAARLAILTPAKLAPLWQGHPDLDEVVEMPPGGTLWATARLVRGGRYDLALVLPNSPRAALECWLGGVPRRVGRAAGWRDWLLTRAVPDRPGRAPMRKLDAREVRRRIAAAPAAPVSDPPPAAHQSHDYLHLVAALGADPGPLPPRLAVKEAEVAEALAAFLPPGSGEAPGLLLGLNPGAEYGPAKRWPAEHFIAAAREVTDRVGPCRWLVFGAAADRALAERIALGVGPAAVNLAGRTSLRELMALLRACRVVLTNDTGPMHLAAALGTPVVALFGSTSPVLTGPGLPGDPRHRLLRGEAACAPCFQRECPVDFRCLAGLAPARAALAVLELLGNGD